MAVDAFCVNVKLVQCVRKAPELSTTDFRKRWKEYGQKVREIAGELDAVRVAIDTTLEAGINRRLAEERGTRDPYDGVAQVWWKSGADLVESLDEEAAQARLARLREFQESFVDLGSSSFFYVIEESVHDV